MRGPESRRSALAVLPSKPEPFLWYYCDIHLRYCGVAATFGSVNAGKSAVMVLLPSSPLAFSSLFTMPHNTPIQTFTHMTN